MCDASIAATLVPDGDDEAARAVLHNLHAVLYTQDVSKRVSIATPELRSFGGELCKRTWLQL